MERRSLVLSAFIVAIVATGVLVYAFGGIDSGQLSSRTEPQQTDQAMEDGNQEGQPVVDEATAQENEATEAGEDDAVLAQAPEGAVEQPELGGATTTGSETTTTDSATATVAGAQDVAPSAEAGMGTNILLVAILAIVIGSAGLIQTVRSARQ